MSQPELPEFDDDLRWFGAQMGAQQLFGDRQVVAMLLPHLAGKTMAELTPAEVQELLTAAARSFPVRDDDDD
ncbi:MAG TPA: hypothetical protein DCQ32_09570 [Cyanobacteria bacterium UBA8156]|jgi:hypothetical protein|nr:hypothetical protein [Cyanobacteria bacterium UBA8156]